MADSKKHETSVKTYLTLEQKRAFKVKTVYEEVAMSDVISALVDLYLSGQVKVEVPTRQKDA
jgi:hypothetical protein